MACSGVIAQVRANSIAAEMGVTTGDKLLAVNGQQLQDIIDLSFALADEFVELLIEKPNGMEETLEIEKDYNEELGIEFESAVFDGVRRCANRCIFCFVDQMPPNMRESLYIKDDDYRLSFLYGNFVTLTNLLPKDMKRIHQLHLSPLYISVHTTNGDLRRKMLGNQRASDILKQMNQLIAGGIQFHTQVVLCPGINDDLELERTFRDLFAMHENVLSMAIVPVGLSRHRDQCYSLQKFTQQQAAEVIENVHSWQAECRAKLENSFVYLADEFYIIAGYPIPEYEAYDDFPQLENGIGLIRDFISQWHEIVPVADGYQQALSIDVICGVSAVVVLQTLVNEVNIPNLTVRLLPVSNHFFGSNITVSGLLTGQDIIDALAKKSQTRTGIIIPGVSLRKGENIFLDDKTVEDIEKSCGCAVRIAHNGAELHQLLQEWR